MGKSAIDAKRSNVFMLDPACLTLVTDKSHPLYDPRVMDEPSESMIANIAMNGVLEPIIVRKNGSDIEVIAGRGRTKATLEANRRLAKEGKPTILIPAIIKGGSDADLFGILISENEIRRDDSVVNKGEKARKLLNMGYTVQQIAVTFGVSRQSVDNWLEVQELPEPIKNAVKSGDISATAAAQLSEYSKDDQVRRFDAIKESGIKPTVRNMRDVPKMKTRTEIEKRMRELDDGEYAKALRWVLGMEEA